MLSCSQGDYVLGGVLLYGQTTSCQYAVVLAVSPLGLLLVMMFLWPCIASVMLCCCHLNAIISGVDCLILGANDLSAALGVTDYKSSGGQAFRVDANVSLHRQGEPLGVRTEIKNMNSLKDVRKGKNPLGCTNVVVVVVVVVVDDDSSAFHFNQLSTTRSGAKERFSSLAAKLRTRLLDSIDLPVKRSP